VLVADDDLSVRVVTRRILQRRGFRVIEACDGEECLAVLAEHAADVRVVLLDVVMPNLDGEATLREIRRRYPGMHVLLASGYTNLDLVRRAREDAPDGFFPKPFDFGELVKRLRELAGA
jgi:CheY-like chemotaxis protein